MDIFVVDSVLRNQVWDSKSKLIYYLQQLAHCFYNTCTRGQQLCFLMSGNPWRAYKYQLVFVPAGIKLVYHGLTMLTGVYPSTQVSVNHLLTQVTGKHKLD